MTQQAKKMSSASPLPPPTPPAQKPTRIIKARPPMRPRPYLPPRPASDKLTPANHATTAAPDVSRKVPEPLHKPEDISTRVTVSEEAVPPEPSIAKHPVITLEPVTPPEPATTAEPAKEHLNALKHTGNVKKIVGQFDHGVVQQDKEPTHPPPLPEKKLPPQPVKPARVTRRPSDVAAPLPKNKAVNLALNCTENGIEGLAIQSHDAGDKGDKMKDNYFEQVGGGQLELREDQPDSRQSEHTEGQHVNMQNVPVCRRDCPCSCHAKRPGMVMVWVPESKVKSLCVEEEVATLSDSSSSADDSPPFHQVFVVNQEPTDGTKHSSAEDVNGNLSGEIANSKNSRTSKTSMALLSKKPFSGSYPVRRQSLTSATGTTNCMKNPGLTNGHHDGKTQEDSSGSSVVLTSYRSMPDSSFSDDEAFMPITDCKGGSTASTPVSETLPEPPCEAAPATASVLKPPRKSKLGSQTSMENEAPQPPIPPKAPRKPPRTSLAPLPFFRKGSLKKQSDKDILEEESPVTDGPLHRRRAAKADRGRPFSSSKEQKEDLGDSSFEEISTEDCETHSSDQTGKNSDGAPVSGGPSVTSPKSIDWESRLQDEPLYQTYRQAVIRKEIKRQTVPRNSSITSFDVNSECSPTSSEYGGNSPRSRRSITPQNTLWQELPAVRESGILEQMSQEERKMQESMFEVLTSEASYLRSLSVLTEHFMESRELDDTIIIREKKILFSNILRVKEVSERFLKDLEERVDESLYITDICDIIYSHAQQNFLVYIDYVRNQVYQEKTYSSLMERNVQFATVITRLQELPQCQRLPFMSFLLLPFQRITRIKMLIENILKRSKEGSTREQNALKAFASVSKIIEECNSEVGRMKQMEELIHITKKIEFDKIKAVPIISQARYLEKQGELSEVIQKGSLFGIKPKFTPVYFFLFNDFLLITHRKSSERHVVVDYAHRSLVQVQGCADYPHGATTMENGFFLTLLENHQGKTCDRLFKAPTQSDMHRWMGAFPNKKEQTHASDETIYEDWDCPQVQCVESYVAIQADELDLEPTDIINILRKTTEGWCEGIRLSDGLKGWFPSKYVQEITNEHVRRRNLRERYRVLQAARQIQITKTSDPKKKYYST